MEITYLGSSPLTSRANLLAIPVYGEFNKDPLVKEIDKTLGGRLLKQASSENFEAKLGQNCLIYPGDLFPCGAISLIGGGPKRGNKENLRDIGAYCASVALRVHAKTLAVVLPISGEKHADTDGQMIAEGLVLGNYRFDKYLSSNGSQLPVMSRVNLHSERATLAKGKKPVRSRTLKGAISRGVVIGEATCHARDMVNEPPEFLNPEQVATIARRIAKKHKGRVTTKILGAKECQKLGMGMFLAVARGSVREPKFIHMTYKPSRTPKKVQTFIGKGVTFDSGGYSLKPSAAMLTMKMDMAGCAAVVSAMDAIATLGSPNEVHVITACCENLVSGNAYLLGDVLTSMDNTSVEVTNTDAEGRLTLGDALTYAQEKTKPDELFDFATLTGACVVALGECTAGVFSNDESLASNWMKSCEVSGEDMWRMPLSKKLKSDLKSSIADMRNSGERWGGAITAGLFLEHFVKDTAWVHVDIAGPAFVKKNKGATKRGGTGFAVATIVEHATNA